MEIPEWIISPFEVEVGSANLDNFLKEEFIEIDFASRSKAMYTFKGIGYYWMNEKSVAEHPKLCETIEAILLAFSSWYMIECGFSHLHYLLSKQGITLNIEYGDFRLKFTNCNLIFVISPGPI